MQKSRGQHRRQNDDINYEREYHMIGKDTIATIAEADLAR